MFTIAKQSIINIRFDTDLQIVKNVRKFEFRGHGLRITFKVYYWLQLGQSVVWGIYAYWVYLYILLTKSYFLNLQEATAMNPDMTVEKIEIQQQSTQP